MVTITETSRVSELEQPIRGIIFDKDGTLIQFHSIWVNNASGMIQQFMIKFCQERTEELAERLAQSIGLHGKEVDGDGILAGGTTRDIARAFHQILQKAGETQPSEERIFTWISEKMLELTIANRDFIRPTSNLKQLFHRLKERGIFVGIATADDSKTTGVCLKQLGLDEYFTFIVTADSHEFAKPHGSIVAKFCDQMGLTPKEVAVVGDTNVDLSLAHNGEAGLAIGVLSGASGMTELASLADVIVPTVADMIDKVGMFVWEK